jgi:glutamate synthase (NADPH/NADH) small chain
MDYLTQQNRRCEGDEVPDAGAITAAGKQVIIIGGGDTGADCLGTVHRQGAISVAQFELLPEPPHDRAAENPWPQWPHVFRISSAHEEGGRRIYSVATTGFIGDKNGHVRALSARHLHRVSDNGRVTFESVPGSAFEMPADLVLLAMGFTGPQRSPLLADFDVRLTDRGTVWRDNRWMTSVPGVFTAGDMQRGQSLIVWAIAGGRQAAASIDEYLAAT